MTADEVAFLESRGAEVLAVEGGHGAMLDDPAAAARIVALLEGQGEAAAARDVAGRTGHTASSVDRRMRGQ